MWLLAPISAMLSLLLALYFFFYVKRQEVGSEKIREIGKAIQEGARTFLKREYLYLTIFSVILAILLSVFFHFSAAFKAGFWTGPIFLFGAFSSALAGFLGMEIAVRANSRTANASIKGVHEAFPITYRGGAVMGLSVVGLALLGVSIVYAIFREPFMVLGFSIGASILTLFAKAGGGIYTKTADIGADLVGKVELDLEEDDPRNPAVVADNVGDNVGDVAGMGADLYDSYVAAVMSAMILGRSFSKTGISGISETIPLIFAGIGIIASLISVNVVRIGEEGRPEKALNLATFVGTFSFILLTFLASWYLGYNLRVWGASVVGLISGVVIGMTADYFTSINKKPAKNTAKISQTGTPTNIISGFSYGLISVFPPLVGIGVASAVSFSLLAPLGVRVGLYGVAMSAVGMLSIVGTIVAADAYGPIGDNARGIGKQSGLDKEAIKVTDKLDAAGNTVKAISKGFAIGAAGLTALALLASYQEIVIEYAEAFVGFDLLDPQVLLGIFIGLTIPPLFSALSMLSVSDNSYKMIEEIRRQFNEIPGLREGKAEPDYAACVDVATRAAFQKLVPLVLVSLAATLIVGFTAGIKALAGYLGGAIFSGFLFAILMANSGGLWDNAKKYIEAGNYGGTGSDAHKAAVVGDTVGDPFKDTAGPSLNTLITVMSQTASLFAPLIITFALIGV